MREEVASARNGARESGDPVGVAHDAYLRIFLIGGAGTAKSCREAILPTFDAILIDEAQDLTIAPIDLRFSVISLRFW